MNKEAASGLNKEETTLPTTKSLSFNYKWESIRGCAFFWGLRTKRARKSACVAVSTSLHPLIDSSSTKAHKGGGGESLTSQRKKTQVCIGGYWPSRRNWRICKHPMLPSKYTQRRTWLRIQNHWSMYEIHIALSFKKYELKTIRSKAV